MTPTIGQVIVCQAAILLKEGQPLVMKKIAIDPPTGVQVRLKIVSAGICASDAHFVWGTSQLSEFADHSPPALLGHEGAAIVESVGENVEHLKPGDCVLTTFMPQCNKCQACLSPWTNYCAIDNMLNLARNPNVKMVDGSSLCLMAGLGVYAEYALVKESQVVKIDLKKENLINACVISCAVSTGFFAATNQAKVFPGSKCAIWGIGAIGLNAIKGCKYQQAETIIAIDINNDKKEMATKFGCTDFINPKELNEPLEQHLLKKYQGIDFAFDCFGSQLVIDQALKSLSPIGTFVSVGLCPKDTKIQYLTSELLMGRKILGGFLGLQKSITAFTKLAEMYQNGQYDEIDLMITNHFKLDEINKAFETLKSGKCIRSMIVFD